VKDLDLPLDDSTIGQADHAVGQSRLTRGAAPQYRVPDATVRGTWAAAEQAFSFWSHAVGSGMRCRRRRRRRQHVEKTFSSDRSLRACRLSSSDFECVSTRIHHSVGTLASCPPRTQSDRVRNFASRGLLLCGPLPDPSHQRASQQASQPANQRPRAILCLLGCSPLQLVRKPLGLARDLPNQQSSAVGPRPRPLPPI
jgi:hypothetical protein